jgi:multidrug resistance protein MdtO
MVIAAVLSMIVVITFRIPYGAIGVNCAFILSRENLTETAKSGFYFILSFALWVVLMPVGVRMFAADPMVHFLGEAVTIFLCFYSLKVLTYFPLAAGIVVVATGTMAIWYLPGPPEVNVELTLWQILATAAGALITLLVEVVFRSFSVSSPVADGMGERLKSIEEMIRSYGAPFPPGVVRSITQYAMTGTGMLRQQVTRTPGSAFERDLANALISLVGQSIDLSAAMVSANLESVPPERVESLVSQIRRIREAIGARELCVEPHSTEPIDDNFFLFSRLEAVVRLMQHVLATNSSAHLDPAYRDRSPQASRVFVRDAFSNPEYLRFALAGTAASMLCYVIYVALDWPGISTAVTTCALTALSNIGSSRQKQLLRIGGAAIGGFLFGIGSQVFVLPYIDSITGFTLLFACVTGISAYVATSSPRLSYAGLQMAFAFYLINVTDFSLSLDLTIGRDRTVGILLGIAAMWLVFERLYPRPAAIQMVSMFARSVRLVATLGPAVRDEVNGLFTSVNAEADAVLFESGEQRPAHLAARGRIRRWLSSLRTLYLLELPLAQAEAQQIEATLLKGVTDSLNHIAEFLESQLAGKPYATADHLPGPVPPGLSKSLGLIWQIAHELEQDVLRQPVFMVGES